MLGGWGHEGAGGENEPDPSRRGRENRAATMRATRRELPGNVSVPRSFTEPQRC